METLLKIGQDIQRFRKSEIEHQSTNPSFGRFLLKINDETITAWLVNSENFKKLDFAKKPDVPIYKNQKIGEILILNHGGEHEFKTPTGKTQKVRILNKSNFKPTSDREELAYDISIRFPDSTSAHSFRKLRELLDLELERSRAEKRREEIKAQKEDASIELRANLELEAATLLETIKRLEEEQQKVSKEAKRFIRRFAELRYQPILDAEQERIKRSMIFDGPLIISGGPGTGKTTTLIQRIKFMLSESLDEYTDISRRNREILRSDGWMFYTPNELLRLYLQNSLSEEGLPAGNDRVKVWSEFKLSLLKEYGVVSPDSRGFRVMRSNDPLIVNTAESVLGFREAFISFYIREHLNIFESLIEYDIKGVEWVRLGENVQNTLLDAINADSLQRLIATYYNLNIRHRDEAAMLRRQQDEQIEKYCSNILVRLRNNPQRYPEVIGLLEKTDLANPDEEEDDLDEVQEIPTSGVAIERAILGRLKSALRKASWMKADRRAKLTEAERDLLNKVPELVSQKDGGIVPDDVFLQIGSVEFFRRRIYRVIQGVDFNVLRQFESIYKRFRRKVLQEPGIFIDSRVAATLDLKENPPRLHPDEQSFILAAVNYIVKEVKKHAPVVYNESNHAYIDAFKLHAKPILGIDEATDFSFVDHLAMQSFAHPDISSVTMVGDVMQRMSSSGVASWSELTRLNKETEIFNLQVSYRQSPTLLGLALDIHKETTGSDPGYRAFVESDPREPKPLLMISEDEDEKMDWLSDRIIEIYTAYGRSIPSIAVFVSSEDHVVPVARKLGQKEALADIGISVKACTGGEVLGAKDTVRVFSVDTIKGMEFEAVFFHNLDDLFNLEIDHDLLPRYLYVGLSRATFYFGLTSRRAFPERYGFLSKHFAHAQANWK